MVRTAPPPVGRDGRSALPGARMRDSQAPFARDLDAIPCAGWVARKPAKIIGIELDELPDRPSRVVAEVQSRCVEARSSPGQTGTLGCSPISTARGSSRFFMVHSEGLLVYRAS